MARRPLHRLFGAALGSLACSLVVDTSEIDSGCGDGKKFCAGTCVGVDDPAYGCTLDRCDPCRLDPFGNAFGDRVIPKCERGVCVAETCAFGYGCPDCSKRLLTDPANCGKCGNPCDGEQTCSLGSCVSDGGAGGEVSN